MNNRHLEKLHALAPPLPAREADAEAPIDDLTRILALPRREPLVCEPDENGLLPPATQALVEHVTAQFTRGKRLSCACGYGRRVQMVSQGLVAIWRYPPTGSLTSPQLFRLTDLTRDWSTNVEEVSALERVGNLHVGESVELPPASWTDGYSCITKLNPAQAWTLHEAALVGGIVGHKGVGSGKTLTGLLISLLFPQARLAVLCMEPKQRKHYRRHYFLLREHFRVTSIVFDDDGPGVAPVPGTVPLHLVSYSRLSRTSSSDMLDTLNPNILILDEAHRACGDSAINRRVKRFGAKKIAERESRISQGQSVLSRALYLFDWSGTMENRSVQDTQMLSSFSLGMGSPLPLRPEVAVQWSGVMDALRRPDRISKTALALHAAFGNGAECLSRGSLESQLASAISDGDDGPERAVRQGFQKRRAETLGVITAAALPIKASIYLGEFDVGKVPEVVKLALRKVRAEHQRPDGADLEDRLDEVICAREVAMGFYTYWAFPKHPCTCSGSMLSRCDRCLHIDEWFRRRKAYHKELRQQLALGEQHLDSPQLCWEAAERYHRSAAYSGKLPVWASQHWKLWRDIEPTVEYEERVKWLGHDLPEAKDSATHPGYYVARSVAKWAVDNKAVVWFRSTPLGRKIQELSGLPYFNGGPGCEERLSMEKGDRSIICSIKALGAGTDGLQYKFSDQLVVEFPASNGGNEGAEQLFGRLHREGQRADVINTLGCFHTQEFKDALRQVVNQARWDQDMKKLKQRILMADIDVDY